MNETVRNFNISWLSMGFEDRQYYRDERPRGSIPGFQFSQQSIILSLVVINVAVFLLDAFTPEIRPDHTGWLSYSLALKTDGIWQIWAYITHGFAHASLKTETGIWHIAGNMITLWFLGRPVEYRLGRSEFLKFYLASILIAGIGWLMLSLILSPAEPAFIVGASGAVSAVVVVFIFMYPRENILLMGILPMPAWVLGVLLLVMNLMNAVDPGSHIAWEAHLIGGIFGALYYRQGWKLDGMKFGKLSKLFSSRPKLRVHNPGSSAEKLQQDADQLLEKISRQGEESLTSKERKILKKYSERLRKDRSNS